MGLKFSSVVDTPLDEVFAWHTRPGAISRLMPPWPPVQVEREAGSVRDGQAVLRLPAGLRWVAAHQAGEYDPPHEFADALTSLPLSAVLPWRHTHQFAPAGQRATRVTDVVETPLPARVLRPMFAYRHRQLADDLAAQARAREFCPDPLTIAVTGSSGLIGTALTALLTTGGHHVIRLVRLAAPERGGAPLAPGRSRAGPAERRRRGDPPGRSVDRRAVYPRPQAGDPRQPDHPDPPPGRARRGRHPAGTPAGAAAAGPRAFITASAIGIYGPDRGDEVLTETSARGDGFLADVVARWEDATTPAARAGLRTVQVRTGIVQTLRGGMLRLLYPLFAAGLGGRLGSGKQWLAWIGLDDLLDIYLRAVTDPSLSGPVNAVAPAPVRNSEYTATLAGLLHRPALLPVPGFGPRLLLGGEGAREIAEASQYVRPHRLIDAGHHFRYPELEAALRHMLGREPAVGPAIRVPASAE